jgi:hypothetical protein
VFSLQSLGLRTDEFLKVGNSSVKVSIVFSVRTFLSIRKLVVRIIVPFFFSSVKEFLDISQVINEALLGVNDVLELNVILVALLVLLLFLSLGDISEEMIFCIFVNRFNLTSVELEARRFRVDRHNSFLVFRVRVFDLGVVLLLIDRSKNRDLMPVILHHKRDNDERE